jgi:hypothetical protein
MLADLEAQVRSMIPRLSLAERHELRELLVRLTAECQPTFDNRSEKRTAAEVFPPPPFSEHEFLLRDVNEQQSG